MADPRPLRVLWVAATMAPAGAEMLLLNAAKVHDHEVVDLHCAYTFHRDDGFAASMRAAGVTLHDLTADGGNWAVRLTQLVRSGRFDVVHIHAPTVGVVARAAALATPRRRRPAVVTTVHNNLSTWRPVTRALWRLTGGTDAAVFTVSDDARASTPSWAGRRSATLVHGVLLDELAAAGAHRASVQEELGITDDTFVLATVANLRWTKNHPNLVAAAAHLRDRGRRFCWLFVGEGELEPDVRRAVIHAGLEDSIRFMGRRDDVDRLLARTDLFVLGSDFEGLPVAIMESLAAGVPVVSTAVGGIASMFSESAAVALVPPRAPDALADAVEIVMTDPGVHSRMRRATWTEAERFDIRHAVSVLEDTYRFVARQHGRAA